MRPIIGLSALAVAAASLIGILYADGKGTATPGPHPQNISNHALAQVSYENKSLYQSVMQERLKDLDEKLSRLRKQVQMQTPQDSRQRNISKMIDSIEKRHDAAAADLKRVDKVQANQWDQFKEDFGHEISEVERSYNQLSAAIQ